MIIYGANKADFIKLERNPNPSGEGHYIVTASFHDRSLINDNIFLVEPRKFMEALANFEQLRKGSATLYGSEDFEMKLEPDGGSGSLWISVLLRKNFFTGPARANGRVKSGRITLEGGLSVDGEMMLSILQEFSKLFGET